MPHQHAFVLTPGSAALPSQLSLGPPRLEPSLDLKTQRSDLSTQRSELGLNPQLNLNAQLSLTAELSLHPQPSWHAMHSQHAVHSQQQLDIQPSVNRQQPTNGSLPVQSQHSLSLRPLRSESSLIVPASAPVKGDEGNSQLQSTKRSHARQGITPRPASFEFHLPGSAAQHEATAKLSLSPTSQPHAAAKQPAVLQQLHDSHQQQSAFGLGAQQSVAMTGPSSAMIYQNPGHAVQPLNRRSNSSQAERGPRISIEDFSSMKSQLNQLQQQLHQMPDPSGRGSRPQTAEGRK